MMFPPLPLLSLCHSLFSALLPRDHLLRLLPGRGGFGGWVGLLGVEGGEESPHLFVKTAIYYFKKEKKIKKKKVGILF